MAPEYTHPIVDRPLPRTTRHFPLLRLQSGIALEHNGMRFHESGKESWSVYLKTDIGHCVVTETTVNPYLTVLLLNFRSNYLIQIQKRNKSIFSPSWERDAKKRVVSVMESVSKKDAIITYKIMQFIYLQSNRHYTGNWIDPLHRVERIRTINVRVRV